MSDLFGDCYGSESQARYEYEWSRICEIENAIEAIERALERPANEAEIAARLGLSVLDYRNLVLDLGRAGRQFFQNTPDGKVTLRDWMSRHSVFHGIPADEAARLIAGALEHMPFNERTAVSLCSYEQLTPHEVARAMDLSITAVSFLVTHAVFRVRSYLRRNWPLCPIVH